MLTNNTFQDLQLRIEMKSTQSVRVPIAKYFSSGLRDATKHARISG
jgi:RNA polymerase-interacting CarD/CdnL/TRCF family regulator